jgi:hypothetical protein
LHVFGTTFPLARIERSTSVTNSIRSTFSAIHRTSGDMVDGFGPDISFAIIDNAGVDNEIANFGAVRDGADNSGALVFSTVENGVLVTIKAILKANGNFGIGTTAPGSKLAVNGTITESTDGTNYYPVVTQQDIGTEPNEIPLNQHLGDMAYQTAESVSILGGLVRGESGSVSAPNGVPVAIATLPDVRGGCWIVNIYLPTNVVSTWSSTYLVNTQSTSVVITPLRAGDGAGFALTNTGLTLLVSQGSGGGPFEIVWSTLRIL